MAEKGNDSAAVAGRRAVAALRASALGRRIASAKERLAAVERYDRGVFESPAGIAKRRYLLRLFQERAHETFVESGTYLGDTVAFFVPHARRIVSVEIEPSLHAAARRRFSAEPHVDIVFGDAADCIPRILAGLEEGCMLWLDGHFSGGETGRGDQEEPVIRVLGGLRDLRLEGPFTVVVDDLRLFGRAPGFPTLEELIAAARSAFPSGRICAGPDSLVVVA